ncbi:hypothetical protein BJY21_000769 [Kineosphaera limosa]|uniref:Putative glycosyltransferase n=1 Tax=Kineosphaera limosa NBRC 100340 TaxID=1184609 RepID=K6X132_9MICO|nr:glycosyltransferase family A protein [Kineosphaera limosa]NYD99584.1 hypothetical protein [Kineosphaera limosa]GAB98082.1 putative glycosyltransferase [Kineosphaera limosa NBRC 100340]
MTGRRYVIISPCRDEARYLQRTLDSVAAQSEPPALWVVVDDGSTDATPAILAEFAAQHSYLRVLTLPPRATRVLGPAVVHAFDAGLATIDLDDFDFVVKLDMDLDLPPTYFAVLMDKMAADPRLASASGIACTESAEGLVPERGSFEITVGMSKFYRVAAFRDIGGFVPVLMWDGIDCHSARVKGWRARAFDEPALRFVHLRPMGSSDRGMLRGKRRHGRGQYLMGSHPVFVAASVLARARDEPRVIGAANVAAGYLRAFVTREPRSQGPEFRRQLRRFQLESLALGKERAVRRWEERQEPAWRPPVPRR